MKRQVYITILVPAEHANVLVTEHLRYMGAISVYQRDTHPGAIPPENIRTQMFPHVLEGEALVTVRCPDNFSAQTQTQWSRQHMERLHSFCESAVLWEDFRVARVLQHTASLGNVMSIRREFAKNREADQAVKRA